jgi:hypothetical protein
MAFGKPKADPVGAGERDLDPSAPNDKRIILEFEKELEPYRNRSKTLFRGTSYQVTLSGFWLYLHEKNLFRYSERYRTGAVVLRGSEGTLPYLEALRKHNGLCRLMDQRRFREDQENEAMAAAAA